MKEPHEMNIDELFEAINIIEKAARKEKKPLDSGDKYRIKQLEKELVKRGF